MHISEAIQPVSKLLTAYHIAQGHTDTPFPKDGCTQGACPQYVALVASWAAADSTTDADPPPVGIGYQSVHPGAADLSLDGAGGETVKPSALYPTADESDKTLQWWEELRYLIEGRLRTAKVSVSDDTLEWVIEGCRPMVFAQIERERERGRQEAAGSATGDQS